MRRMFTPGPLPRAMAILIVALFLGGAAGASVASPVTPGSGATQSAAAVSRHYSAVPSALQQPWAARSGFDSGRLSQVSNQSSATGQVAVTVTLWPSTSSFFSAIPAGAPSMNTSQVAQAYGLPPAQYDALARYFENAGLVVTHAWPDHLSMSLSGPAPAVAAAFGTSLTTGDWHGHAVRAVVSVPHLPAPYGPEIAAISGLDTGFSTFTIPFASVSAPGPAHFPPPSAVGGRTTQFVTPATIHSIYDLDGLYNYSGTPHWATGQGIALVLWGYGYSPSDLQDFYANFYPAGFPPVHIAAYPIDTAPQPSAGAVNDPSGAAQELTLDMEWAGSEAPGATLYAVYAPDGPANNNYSPTDPTLEDALNQAINLTGVHVVSMSFGTPDSSDPPFQAAFSMSFRSAEHRDITVLAASGDNGGDTKPDCTSGTSPQFPAASPDVLAVGGTAPVLTLDAVGTVTGIDSEPAWNLSGGGYSAAYSAPSWQMVGSAKAPISQHGYRGIPDVAGPAAYNFFYFNGAAAAGKGTSFATPMWAGMIAEMDAVRGSPLGFIDQHVYAVGASQEVHQAALGLIDVTNGANCLGSAMPGWDTTTGWGSPRALLLYQDLTYSFVDMRLSTTSSTVAPGGSVQATVQILNSTSHRPIAGLPVIFTLDAVGNVGLCTGTLSNGNVSTDANGNATFGLGVPGCYFGSHIAITATMLSHGYFGSNTTTLTVNLLGLAGFLAFVQFFPYNVIAFAVIMVVATLGGLYIGRLRHRRAIRRANASRGVARPTDPATPVAADGEAAAPIAPPPATSPPAPTAPSSSLADPPTQLPAEEETAPGPIPEVPAHVVEPPS